MELKINDMMCGGCAASVTRAVRQVDDTATLDIDVATHRVTIRSDVEPRLLLEAIEAAGFHPAEQRQP